MPRPGIRAPGGVRPAASPARARSPCRHPYSGCQHRYLRACLGYHDRHGGHHGPARTAHRGGHRERVLGDLTTAHRHARAPDFGEGAAQPGRVGDGVRREGGQRPLAVGLLGRRVAVREERQAHARGVQRPAGTDPDVDADGRASGEPLDVDDLVAVADRELHVLVRRLVQVLQVRQRDLAQRETARGQRRELPEPEPDVVDPVRVPLQGAPLGERAHQAVGRGEGQPGPAADVGQGERRVVVVEGGQHGEQPVRGGPGGARRRGRPGCRPRRRQCVGGHGHGVTPVRLRRPSAAARGACPARWRPGAPAVRS